MICDENVNGLLGKELVSQLKANAFDVEKSSFPAGESSKCLSQYQSLTKKLLTKGVDRGTLVINCGGGVTGDLGGFVSATLLRGIEHVHIPTTLLAMIDSSIGGKVGINNDLGKNLLGAFWNPCLILADPNLLKTLPEREIKCGLGEMLKTMLLLGEAQFSKFLKNAKENDVLELIESKLIFECMEFKAKVVTKDPKESGLRKILNLGHTVGHAIEKSQGYKGMSHGEAVGLGCLAACKVSNRLGLADKVLGERVREALMCMGMEADVSPWLNQKTLGHVIYDKKIKDGKIDFVAIVNPGEIEMIKISVKEMQRILCDG